MDTPQITIRLLSFGIARERTGKAERSFGLPEASTTGDLRRYLDKEFDLSAGGLLCGLAVNEVYVDDHCILREGDEVAIIPPVSGG